MVSHCPQPAAQPYEMFKYVVFLYFANFVEFGSSIRCYECNSANNSMCLDPTLYDRASVQKYLRVTTCEKTLLAPPKGQMFCRKITQTILHKGHDPEVRVTRGCGWVKHHRDCYKADNEDHLETVCQCFDDTCNGAPPLRYGVGIFIAAVVMFK